MAFPQPQVPCRHQRINSLDWRDGRSSFAINPVPRRVRNRTRTESTATPSGTMALELSRKIKSSRPIFPKSIKGEAFTTQTSLTVHLGLDFLRF